MTEIKIKIENLERLKAAFSNSPETVAPFLRDAGTKSAFAVERYAKILTPVDTGRLRSSIATSLGILNKGLTSIVSTNVFYAVYVHEGTRRVRGRPFMKQGAERAKSEIQQYFQEATERALQEVAKQAQ